MRQESQSGGTSQARLFNWAIEIGREVSHHKQQGTRIPRRLRLKWQVADRFVFRTVRNLFGGRIRFFISGGAPLSKDIAEFFHACGLLILEGYGLTESTAASTFNLPDNFRFGTVGLPIPGCEIAIADDGEVLLRSRALMGGYYNRPDDTRQALTPDGWLKTGDIGILHPTGHLQITDRKKEIIVTSRGKNIAPSNFENRLKAASPVCSYVVMHGDRRPYCSAIIGLHGPALMSWATDQELAYVNYADLVTRQEVYDLVMSAVMGVNQGLPSYEQVRQFVLMTEEPSVENGLLTPTLKLKRRVAEKRYNSELNHLYR